MEITKKDIATIERVLRAKTHVSASFLAAERLGNVAFDYVMDNLLAGQRSGREMVNGVRLLAFLTRHACHNRKLELLDVCLRLARSTDAPIRSAAIEVAVANAHFAIRGGQPKVFDAVLGAARNVDRSALVGNAADIVEAYLHDHDHRN